VTHGVFPKESWNKFKADNGGRVKLLGEGVWDVRVGHLVEICIVHAAVHPPLTACSAAITQ
jgi:hypothetical protein